MKPQSGMPLDVRGSSPILTGSMQPLSGNDRNRS